MAIPFGFAVREAWVDIVVNKPFNAVYKVFLEGLVSKA
jgi:hypothetical protein